MTDYESYVSIKDEKGVAYLCPMRAVAGQKDSHRAIREDVCVEADVAGRYAGMISIQRRR